jgi:branched-chain amino acid transport system permease protein
MNLPFLPRRWGSLLALACVLASLPFMFTGKFAQSILILIGLNAIVCVGLNLLVGTAGQISLGHAAFFGIGAYVSAILTGDCGCNGVLAMGAGVLASCAIAWLIGRPILQLKGHYLAMATLGVGLVIYLILVREAGFTGGPDGRAVAPLSLFGATLHGEAAWYWAVAAALWAVTWAAENLSCSPWGRSLLAIHASEPAAAAVGVDVHALKVAVFVTSAALASMAGSLYAHAYAFITPDQAGFMHSVQFMVMIVVGGLGSVYGGIVGAALLVSLPQWMVSFKDYENIAFGLMLMIVPFALRQGLVPALVAALGKRR